MKRLLLAALWIVAAPIAAQAQVEIKQAPDYKPGDVIRSVSEVKTKQTLVLAGMIIDTNLESFSATKETIGERTSDGKTPISTEFEYFIVNLETPLGKYAFDSNSPDAGNKVAGLEGLDDLFKALSTAKWTAVMNDKPEIESLKFEGDPFGNLDEASKKEVSSDRMLQDYNLQFARFPDAPVNVGDKWTRTEEMMIGNGQFLKFEREFEYLGTEESGGKVFDKIGIKALSVQYGIGEGSSLPLKLDDSKLEIASTEGTMLYDRELKTITSTSEKTRMKGDINFSIDINGQKQKLPGQVDLTIESKHTVEPPQQGQ
jgi:hypothetical protein